MIKLQTNVVSIRKIRAPTQCLELAHGTTLMGHFRKLVPSTTSHTTSMQMFTNACVSIALYFATFLIIFYYITFIWEIYSDEQ